VQRGEDGDLQRIDGQGAGRDLAHFRIDVFGQRENIVVVPVRTDIVGLIVDFDTDRLFGRAVFVFAVGHKKPISG